MFEGLRGGLGGLREGRDVKYWVVSWLDEWMDGWLAGLIFTVFGMDTRGGLEAYVEWGIGVDDCGLRHGRAGQGRARCVRGVLCSAWVLG